MRTLLLILFPILSYSQSFMMDMEVREFYKNNKTIVYDTVKVIWMVGEQRDIILIWDKKVLYFTKDTKNPNKQQRRAIKEIKKQYNYFKKFNDTDKHFKIRSMYIDHRNESYFITVYMNNGILIWISRLNERLPCYFFRMI